MRKDIRPGVPFLVAKHIVSADDPDSIASATDAARQAAEEELSEIVGFREFETITPWTVKYGHPTNVPDMVQNKMVPGVTLIIHGKFR